MPLSFEVDKNAQIIMRVSSYELDQDLAAIMSTAYAKSIADMLYGTIDIAKDLEKNLKEVNDEK